MKVHGVGAGGCNPLVADLSVWVSSELVVSTVSSEPVLFTTATSPGESRCSCRGLGSRRQQHRHEIMMTIQARATMVHQSMAAARGDNGPPVSVCIQSLAISAFALRE
eukprot:scaffold2360_cov380-Prasinococcus_capsulatus_cf.AAC.7